ncbi:hypothetical protein M8818_003671 [Zalaria obscura]|uniref:Uncharacterized protein n=1 Tax=Zalaria obscura TaxID=2024903 RepID=A0ACC3SDZ4_9PEZI
MRDHTVLGKLSIGVLSRVGQQYSDNETAKRGIDLAIAAKQRKVDMMKRLTISMRPNYVSLWSKPTSWLIKAFAMLLQGLLSVPHEDGPSPWLPHLILG